MSSTKQRLTTSVISFKAGIRATVRGSCGEQGPGLYDDAAASAIATCALCACAYRNACGFVENLCDTPIMLRTAF